MYGRMAGTIPEFAFRGICMSDFFPRHAAAALLFFCASFLCVPAMARLHLVKPGQVPELEAGEGLLVVVVDSNMPLSRVKVRKDNGVFGGGDLRGLPEGRSLRL